MQQAVMPIVKNIKRKIQHEIQQVNLFLFIKQHGGRKHAYKLGLNKVTGKAGKPKKSVLQIDIKTNQVIAEYKSIAEAARAVGIKTSSNIGGCCKNLYGRKTIAGYKWEYKNKGGDVK